MSWRRSGWGRKNRNGAEDLTLGAVFIVSTFLLALVLSVYLIPRLAMNEVLVVGIATLPIWIVRGVGGILE